MAMLTYNYAYFAAGEHKRHPTRTGPGGFVVFESDPVVDLTPSPPPPQKPNLFKPAGTLETTKIVNGTVFNFCYVTLSGGLDPTTKLPVGLTSFEPGNLPGPVQVANTPITLLAVYVPPSGGPPGNGVTIDAFDETTGALFNDIFVSVAPDPTGQETQQGNDVGWVNTANAAETITALSPTSPAGVNFKQWVTLSSPGKHQVSKALAAKQHESFIALAFYDAPPPSPPPPPPSQGQVTCTNELASLNQLILAELTPFLAQQWTDYQTRLHNCVNQGFLPKGQVDSAIQRYNELLKTKHNTPPPMKP